MNFINRQKEMEYLQKHFASEPNSLLFIHGPKSCGKSTLLRKVVKTLDPEKQKVFFMDLRRVDISNYEVFRNAFFQVETKEKITKSLESLINKFVDQDYWFYLSARREILPNNKSLLNSMKKIVMD